MQYNEGGTHNNLHDFQNPTNINFNMFTQEHPATRSFKSNTGKPSSTNKAKPRQQSSEDCSQILGSPGSVKS